MRNGRSGDCTNLAKVSQFPSNFPQEALSRVYVEAIAAKAGLISSVPNYDYGIDVCLRSVRLRGRRHTDAGGQLDVQLKSTTHATLTETHVVYDLDVKAHDDLREEGDNCPRILVLLVLPKDDADWLAQSEDELAWRRCAYWFSLRGAEATPATTTVRISIPRENVFSVETVQTMLARLRGRENT